MSQPARTSDFLRDLLRDPIHPSFVPTRRITRDIQGVPEPPTVEVLEVQGLRKLCPRHVASRRELCPFRSRLSRIFKPAVALGSTVTGPNKRRRMRGSRWGPRLRAGRCPAGPPHGGTESIGEASWRGEGRGERGSRGHEKRGSERGERGRERESGARDVLGPGSLRAAQGRLDVPTTSALRRRRPRIFSLPLPLRLSLSLFSPRRR